MYQFKTKDSEVRPNPLYLHNISKDFTVDNVKKRKNERNVVRNYLKHFDCIIN